MTNQQLGALTPQTGIQLLTTAQAAKMLCVSESFLERDRWAGARIPYVKVGRSVRYQLAELDAYIASRIRRSTSEASE